METYVKHTVINSQLGYCQCCGVGNAVSSRWRVQDLDVLHSNIQDKRGLAFKRLLMPTVKVPEIFILRIVRQRAAGKPRISRQTSSWVPASLRRRFRLDHPANVSVSIRHTLILSQHLTQ